MSWIPRAIGFGAAAALTGLAASRRSRERRLAALRASLQTGRRTGAFLPETLADLPPAARRYLLHSMAPGAHLASSVLLRIEGAILLRRGGDRLPMESEEVLAPPRGFLWTARVEKGPLTIRGFDSFVGGQGETRWWLAGVVPVASGGGPDVSRSARGRLFGESFLLPSSLLPSSEVRWEPVDEQTARVHLGSRDDPVTLTLDVSPEGRLRRLAFPRWNSDPTNGPIGYLPFVCDRLEDERTFAGYTIPTRFRAGWGLGGEEAFPFFFAQITSAEYR